MSESIEERSRFARRTAWDRSASELQDSFRLSADVPLLDLTVSNPTACGLNLDAAEILTPLQDLRTLQYVPDSKGLLSAREAVARYYADHAAAVSPEQILLTASTSESYGHLFRLLCDAGDEVLVAQPSYPLFGYLAGLADVSLRSYPLFYDYGWWIDIAELERAITSRTRAIVVVHPNNPTGHPVPPEEREQLYGLCVRHELSLIVDEVFLDFPHDPAARLPSFAQGSAPALTFVLSGLSKIAALPQMKLGWMVVRGPDRECNEALARLDVIADTFLSVNTPAQLALPHWLGNAPALQREIRCRIADNLALLRGGGLALYEVSAGWSAILRLPRLFEQQTAYATLRDAGILTHPAHFYGLREAGSVVLSLIVPRETMQQAVERLRRLLETRA